MPQHGKLGLPGSQPTEQALDRKKIETRDNQDVRGTTRHVDPDGLTGSGDYLALASPHNLQLERHRPLGMEPACRVVPDVQEIDKRERLRREATVVQEHGHRHRTRNLPHLASLPRTEPFPQSGLGAAIDTPGAVRCTR
jgi:hypothetical protein